MFEVPVIAIPAGDGTLFDFLNAGHTNGHEPVKNLPHAGSRMRVRQEAHVQGPLRPQVNWTHLFNFDDARWLLRMVTGGENTAGTWGVSTLAPYWSVGVNDGEVFWQYSAGKLDSLTLSGSPGSAIIASPSMSFLRSTQALIAAWPLPAVLSYAPSFRPYTWHDAVLAETAPVAQALSPNGWSVTFDTGLLKKPKAGSRELECLTDGDFTVSGTLNFNWSTETNARLWALIRDYDDFVFTISMTVPTGATVLMTFRCTLENPQKSIPDGNAPMTLDVNFECAAQDFDIDTSPSFVAAGTYT